MIRFILALSLVALLSSCSTDGPLPTAPAAKEAHATADGCEPPMLALVGTWAGTDSRNLWVGTDRFWIQTADTLRIALATKPNPEPNVTYYAYVLTEYFLSSEADTTALADLKGSLLYRRQGTLGVFSRNDGSWGYHHTYDWVDWDETERTARHWDKGLRLFDGWLVLDDWRYDSSKIAFVGRTYSRVYSQEVRR